MGCGGSKQKPEEQKQVVGGTNAPVTLLDPIKLGDFNLKNRIVMAAMTRGRCDPRTNVPSALNATYYGQRASFGLILTECAAVSARGNGYYGSGAIFNNDQVEGWKLVTNEVHKNGGLIFQQIVHVGRATSAESLGGIRPLAPSPIAAAGKPHGSENDYPVPEEMNEDQIKQVIQEFKEGALNAIQAGFDGVEIHGANGYLIDQFLRSKTNNRTDQYGGTAENRARFCLEVVDAVAAAIGKGKLGIKLSPCGNYNDMLDDNPVETYKYLLGELDKRGILFVEISVEDPKNQIGDVLATLSPFYKGTIIANSGFDETKANDVLSKGQAQLVSFAQLAITNPDLPNRFKNQKPVDTNVNYGTAFFGKEQDYTTYNNAE